MEEENSFIFATRTLNVVSFTPEETVKFKDLWKGKEITATVEGQDVPVCIDDVEERDGYLYCTMHFTGTSEFQDGIIKRLKEKGEPFDLDRLRETLPPEEKIEN